MGSYFASGILLCKEYFFQIFWSIFPDFWSIFRDSAWVFYGSWIFFRSFQPKLSEDRYFFGCWVFSGFRSSLFFRDFKYCSGLSRNIFPELGLTDIFLDFPQYFSGFEFFFSGFWVFFGGFHPKLSENLSLGTIGIFPYFPSIFPVFFWILSIFRISNFFQEYIARFWVFFWIFQSIFQDLLISEDLFCCFLGLTDIFPCV